MDTVVVKRRRWKNMVGLLVDGGLGVEPFDTHNMDYFRYIYRSGVAQPSPAARTLFLVQGR